LPVVMTDCFSGRIAISTYAFVDDIMPKSDNHSDHLSLGRMLKVTHQRAALEAKSMIVLFSISVVYLVADFNTAL